MKKLFRLLVTLVLLALVLSIVGVLFARQLLVVQTANPKRAQTIVVLGGDSENRATRAVEVMRSRYAARVIVTGEGEDAKGAHQAAYVLRKAGVPDLQITIEPKASSTKENADFTVPILRTNKMTNVILVTSWYHSRRALACFQKAAPEITFQSLPTKAVVNDYGWPNRQEIVYVLKEYVKTIGYAVKYRIW